MKKLYYYILILLLLICSNIYPDVVWKHIKDYMDIPLYYWYQSDVFYTPVEDCIYKIEKYNGYLTIYCWDYGDIYIYSYDIENTIKYKSIYPVNSSSLFNEKEGLGVPFGVGSYQGAIFISNGVYETKRYCVESDLPDVFYPIFYVSNSLMAGKFIETFNNSEGIVTSSNCLPADSHSILYDGNKILNYDHLWNSEWSAAPMVWDERRNVVVKYGVGDFGWTIYHYFDNGTPTDCGDGRLREWDGTTWTLRLDIPEPHPPDRMQRMVYDEARGIVVLFSIFGETWEYDGKTWRDVTDQAGRIPFYSRPQIVYDTAHNRIVAFEFSWIPGSGFNKTESKMYYLEDDATTQTYSRRNVMQEGCEMRTWGETGVDCAFTSSTKWSRIIVVKTEDGTSPDFARDHPTSGILSATMLWEIKTDRPPEPIPAQTTGTLVSISYPTDLVDRLTLSTDTLRLCVSRPAEPIGVPIADTEKNSDRAFFPWRILQQIDHPPLPGEFGIYHDTDGRRFLFRTTMREPFQGSPSGPPRMDGKPASLCYTIVTTTPDIEALIKDTLLGCRNPSSKERPLLDQNADGIIDIADLVTLLSLWSK